MRLNVVAGLILLVSIVSGCDQPQSTKTDTTIEPATIVEAPEIKQTDKPQNQTTQHSDKSIVEDLGFSSANNNFKLADDKSNTLLCLRPDDNKKQTDKADALVKEVCKRMSDRLASVKYQSCIASELQTTGCHSATGTPILVREFPPIKNTTPRGKVLVIGGTHGDELTSVSVTMRWIEQLSKNHTGLFHWHMAPLMNPDAVFKRSATRTNHNGVDLNRNLPSNDWNEKALKYWHQKSGKDKRKYPGEKAASEPETQWLIDEINHFKPDAIISVHAPYGVVDFDSLLLNTAPKSLGKLHLNLLGTYPGSLGNYAGINRNIPVITLELPHSWEMPSMQESNQIWQDIVQWLKQNVKKTAKN